jgi:hypothetical protein
VVFLASHRASPSLRSASSLFSRTSSRTQLHEASLSKRPPFGDSMATVYTSLKHSVAATNSLAMPGSIPECPASGTTWKSASGRALCSSHAVVTGHTTSYLRTRAPPMISQVHSSSIDHSKTLDAPALDDDGRDVADLERVVQQEALSREKSLVYEVVALDARECLGGLWIPAHLSLCVRLRTASTAY